MDELDRGLVRLPAPANVAPKHPADSILVKEVNWLGDLVMSLPALRAIRKAYPSARLSVLVKKNLAGFFDGITWLDVVIDYPDAERNLKQKLNVVRNLRPHRFDLAVLFPNSFESALWVMLAGIPRRAGFATDARRLMLTDTAAPQHEALRGHQSQYWLSMIRETLGVEADDHVISTPLEASAVHLERMRAWLSQRRTRPRSPLIALAPIAAYGPAKEWPMGNYAALIDQLAHRFDAECVIIGAAAESPRCNQLASVCHSRPLVAAGEINLGELIALLSLCDGFAGNDSGAMHLAGGLGLPTVGIFGSTDPLRTHALGPKVRSLLQRAPCSPCLARSCRFGHYDCLKAISPEEVISTLAELGAFRQHYAS